MPNGSQPRRTNPRARREAGLAAERLAETHLVTRGWFPLARNHVVRGGEVDLVMRDGAEVVFVEVKRRRTGGVDRALESVTPAKQARVVRAATDYLVRAGLCEAPVRFDVVVVTGGPGASSTCLHIPAAFDASVTGEGG